jgi:hypothetical protein
MYHRRLALLGAVTLGDYLLWNWSLAGNHDVLAIAAGLSLLPLIFACLWLLGMSVLHLISSSTGRSQRGRAAPPVAPRERAGGAGPALGRPLQARAPASSAGKRAA